MRSECSGSRLSFDRHIWDQGPPVRFSRATNPRPIPPPESWLEKCAAPAPSLNPPPPDEYRRPFESRATHSAQISFLFLPRRVPEDKNRSANLRRLLRRLSKN